MDQFSTNAVSFGKFLIVLEKEQLSYYSSGVLTRVADVTPQFSNIDLFDLAVRIATKNEYGPAKYVYTSAELKKYKKNV